MIVAGAPSLEPAEAARRAGRGRLPVWLTSPGDADVGVEREIVACDPVRVVSGSALCELEEAWHEERALWKAGRGVPIGFGFLGYDLGRQFETIRGPVRAPSGWPDLEFRFYDAVWVGLEGCAEIWARDGAAAGRLAARLAEAGAPRSTAVPKLGALEPVGAPADYLQGVRRILEYLRAGDVYQVNLARRLKAAVSPDGDAPGWGLFARLQEESPAPHAFWFPGSDGSCLLGNSPERFLRVSPDGLVETRPIKGTRPRAVAGDDATATELAGHPKDLAEHTMIVDLERNDLGRVCMPGSVVVQGFARAVSLPRIHHLVSTVQGRLRADVGLTELLRATFPGGSITGAPKIRAMEIIDELETTRRGPYTGATGWLGAAGDLDLAIAIRTGLLRDDTLTLWVGGGIVADSVLAKELEETVVKARAFARLGA